MAENNLLSFRRVLLLVLVACYAFSRIWGISNKQSLYFDDIATLTTISGNGMAIGDSFRYLMNEGKWTSSEQVIDLIEWTSPFHFSKVSEKLMARDIHPPLYFWLAHAWCSVFGFGSWQLFILQFLIEICLVLLLFKLSRRLAFKEGSLLFVVGLVLIHPALVDSFMSHRHYHLLGLFTLLFHLRYVNSKARERWTDQLTIGLVVLGGVLTHFYFPIVVGAHLVGRLISEGRLKQVLKDAVFFMVIGLLTAALFWGYFKQFLTASRTFATPDNSLLYALTIPLRVLLPNRILVALPFPLAALVWPAIFLGAYWMGKRSPKKIGIGIWYSITVFLVLAAFLLLAKIPAHSYRENRYYIITVVVLFPVLIYMAKSNKWFQRFSLGLLYLGLMAQSIYYFRGSKVEPIKGERVVVISRYVPDAYKVAKLEHPNQLLLVRNMADVLPSELVNATVLWPKYSKASIQDKQLAEKMGLKGSPTPFIFPGWKIPESGQ